MQGFFHVRDAIRDAIRRMQAEEDRIQAWRTAIKKGDEELDRGEDIAYTAQTLNITEAAISSMRSDKPMDRDVLP